MRPIAMQVAIMCQAQVPCLTGAIMAHAATRPYTRQVTQLPLQSVAFRLLML